MSDIIKIAFCSLALTSACSAANFDLSQADRDLLVAADDLNAEGVKDALDRGANVDVQGGGGLTPLMLAVGGFNHKDDLIENQLAIMSILLDHGACVDKTNHYGNTALIFAASNGWPRAVRLLLDHGANINHRGRYGETALDCAIEENNAWMFCHFLKPSPFYSKIARLLCKHGAKRSTEL